MSDTYTLTTDELSNTAVPAFFVFAKSDKVDYELIIYSFDYLNRGEYNTLTANIREAVKNKRYTVTKTDSNKLEVTFEFNGATATRQTFYMDVDSDPLPVANELYSRIASAPPAPLVATL